MLAVTHELKTPLSSIRLFLQTMNKRVLDEEEKKDLTGKAITETDRLNAIIENILVASGLGSGENMLTRSPADLSDFIQTFVEQWQEHTWFSYSIETDIEHGITFDFDSVAMNSMCLDATWI